MNDWKDKVYREFANGWCLDESKLEQETEEWKTRIVNGIEFSEADWLRGKKYRERGWLFLCAYDDKAEDHIGPIRFEINMNDSFCYASAWGTAVPKDRLEDVFAACEAKDSELLSSIAADIEGLPPVNEVIDRMEETGTVPIEKIMHYRQQMKDAGRENEKW